MFAATLLVSSSTTWSAVPTEEPNSPANSSTHPSVFDSTFQEREGRFSEEKRRIGLAAAELIQDHDTVGFTAGTTTTQVARCIRHRSGIQIITNAVNIGMELNTQAALTVTLTGGTMRWAGAFSLTGPMAMESLHTVFLDKAFIGACGMDVLRGATTIEAEEAAVFRAMAPPGQAK